MTGTTFPTVASGWRGAVGWYDEATYGVAPTSQQYKWVGAAQDLKGTVDKQPIFVYRMDGSTNFPAYLLKGQRKVDFVITYWPQDINLLIDDINNIGTATNSHSFIIQDYDTGATYTVTGCVASQVRVSGKTANALEIQITYQCQNILEGLPTGATFHSDPGNVPFFFSQESVQVPAGSPQPQSLTFTGTITNNLKQVPQFGTDVIRSIATLVRTADGELTATFATLSDYPNETNIFPSATVGASNTPPYSNPTGVDPSESAASGLSQQEISLLIGTNGATSYYLNFTGAVIPKVDLTTPISDIVAVTLDWTATGANVGTTT